MIHLLADNHTKVMFYAVFLKYMYRPRYKTMTMEELFDFEYSEEDEKEGILRFEKWYNKYRRYFK